MQHNNNVTSNNNLKTIKNRLIARMVSLAICGVTFGSMMTAYVTGSKIGEYEKDIDALNEQKATCTDTQQLSQIDNEIDELNDKIEHNNNIMWPAAISFLPTAVVGCGSSIYLERQEEKEAKQNNETLSK
ncbi:MAG: hypothetical protein ACLRFE_01095 [Clostridia bacterium]